MSQDEIRDSTQTFPTSTAFSSTLFLINCFFFFKRIHVKTRGVQPTALSDHRATAAPSILSHHSLVLWPATCAKRHRSHSKKKRKSLKNRFRLSSQHQMVSNFEPDTPLWLLTSCICFWLTEIRSNPAGSSGWIMLTCKHKSLGVTKRNFSQPQ